MKAAFWIVFAIGFALCTPGIGRTLSRAGGDWAAPPMLAGIVLGIAILGLAGAFAAGFRPPLLPSDRAMLLALIALVAMKYGVGLAHGAALAFAATRT